MLFTRTKKEMKFSRKNKGNFLIYKEFRGNTLYNELQLGLQAKFSFMIEVYRIFLQLVEFQLTLAHCLTPSHAQGGPNWLAVVMFEHIRMSIVLNQALHPWLNSKLKYNKLLLNLIVQPKQKFQMLHDSEFKPWLSKKPGKDGKLKPFCSWCDIQITCSKTGIRRHSLSSRHCSSKKMCGTNLPIQAMWNNNQFAKEIEPRICAFIAEHALSLTLLEPLITLLRVLFPNDDNLRNVKLGKCGEVW